MPIVTLTNHVIATGLTCPEGKARVELCDIELPGLYVLVSASAPGHGTYFLRYKDHSKKTCHEKIGRTSEISLMDARKKAKSLKATIQLGADPRGEEKARKEVITFTEFFELHYLPYVTPRKRSWKRDEELFRLRIKGVLGSKRLNEITRQQIQTFHTALLAKGLGASCDHHVKLVRHAFNLAIEWDMLDKNPAAKVPLFNLDNKVEHYIDDAQLDKLLAVLRAEVSARSVALIAMFLLSTGARLNEALQATWSQIDRQTRVWRIPASNSKSKRIRAVPLNDSAFDVLDQLETEGKFDNLFVNLQTGAPLTTVHKVWGRPGNVVRVSDIAGLKVDQVLIGSCTNSSYKDMATVAGIMRGRQAHPEVSLGVAPGSRQVLQMATRDGYVSDLLAGGARLLESACGFCIGNCLSPRSGAVSLRTSNRNFEGRSGTRDAQVYLVSPEVAAVAALAGEVRDPRESGIDCPVVEQPEKYMVDDALFVFPRDAQGRDPGPGAEAGAAAGDRATEIYRGRSIGPPPANEPLPGDIRGIVQLKVGDDITTDHIMPAGARLKYRSNVPKYAQYVFEPVDPDFAGRALEAKGRGEQTVIVAGDSYGQGSSREHAALCPMYLGVKAVVAKSIERIHTANLVNFGILPLTFADPADYDRVDQGDEVELPEAAARLARGESLVLLDKTKGLTIDLRHALSPRQREIIRAGGLLAYTVKA